MIAIIRISGHVKLNERYEEMLFRLRLRKKYTCIVLPETKELKANLQELRNLIAYGKISPETLKLLIEKRGKPLSPNKKVDISKALEALEKKGLASAGVKPFFRLHPPRGGIDSKLHYPKGILGDNKEDINELIRRML
jgi:large subunit ribosomal protein L30